MFDSMFPSHWSTLRKLMWLKLKGAAAVWDTITGNPVTFSAKAAPLKQLEVAFSPVQSGSGDPSPDNVRPISGWDGVEVWRTGKNLWDGVWEYGNISDSTGQNSGSSTSYFRSKNYIPFKGGQILFVYHPTRTANFRQYYYDKDNTFLGYTGRAWNTKIDTSTLAYADEIAYIRFRVSGTHDDSTDGKIAIYYTEEEEYTAYNPSSTSISLSFGSTLYSGTLDVLTGVVTVDKVGVTINGTENWEKYTGSTCVYYLDGIPSGKNGLRFASISSHYPYSNESALPENAPSQRLQGATGSKVGPFNRLYISDPNHTTTEDFKDFLATQHTNGTPVTVVYECYPAQTIQLTPQEVSSLLGENNMWSDANGNLTVTYAAEPATTPIVGKGKVGQAIIGG